MRWLPLTLLMLAGGCGPLPAEERGLGFELLVHAAVAEQLGSFQVTVVNDGRTVDCLKIQENCVKLQIPIDRVIRTTDASGTQRLGQRFPAALVTGSGGGREQEVLLTGIPPGSDYAVVIEALSKSDPPGFLGSSCNFQQKVSAGPNPRLIARKLVPVANVPLACDPRWEP